MSETPNWYCSSCGKKIHVHLAEQNIPACPKCGKDMTFIGDPDATTDDLLAVDGTDMEEAMKPTPAEVNPWDGLIYVNGSNEGLVGLPACKNCHGSGQVSAGRVPYGSTTAELPPDMCEACCGTGLNLTDSRCSGLAEHIKQEYQAGYEEGAEWAFVDDDARRPDRFRKAEEAATKRYKV